MVPLKRGDDIRRILGINKAVRYRRWIRLSLNLSTDDIFESDLVHSELADTIGELLSCHLVFIQQPAEGLLVHVDLYRVRDTIVITNHLGDVQGLGSVNRQLLGHGRGGEFLESLEQLGANGQKVAASLSFVRQWWSA